MVSSTKTTATVVSIVPLFAFAVYLNRREEKPIRIIVDEDRHAAFTRAGNFQKWWNQKTKTGTSVMRKGEAEARVANR